jgi:hypothetical protein
MKKMVSLIFALLLSLPFVFAQEGSLGIDPGKTQLQFSTKFFHTGHSSWGIIIAIIIMGFVFIALEQYYKKPFLSLVKNYFMFNSLSIESKTTTSYTQTRLTIYALTGLILSATATFTSITILIKNSHTTWWLITSVFTFQLLLNFITYIILSKLFSQKYEATVLLLTFLYFWAVQSEISFVLLSLLLLLKVHILKVVIAALWTLLLLTLFLRKQHLILKIFSNAGFHLLHFILYFCAVEIMPLLLFFANTKF